MPLTPTVLIATSGLTQGEGIGVSTEMSSAISSATSNPLYTNLTELYAANVQLVPGLSTVLSTLPTFMSNLGDLAANVSAQANAIVPPTPGVDSVKSFISLQSGAAGGAGTLAEFSAALSDFSNKSFGDLGINSKNFTDVITQGVTSMTTSLSKVASLTSQLPLGSLGSIPGLPNPSSLLSGAGSMASSLGLSVPGGGSITGAIGQLTSGVSGLTAGLPGMAATASSQLTSALGGIGNSLSGAAKSIAGGQGASMGGLTSLFGSVGANMDPAALAKGQAALASSSLNDGLANVGTGMKNFGNLYDFSDLQTLGPVNLLVSLQGVGLADSLGINDAINTLGYNPDKPMTVPPAAITTILSNIDGSDLQKIITQTGAVLVKQAKTAADLLDPSFFIPPGGVAALGLGDGAAGMTDLQNTLTNLGIQGSNMTYGAFLSSMKTQAMTYLGQVDKLIPMDVESTLKPLLGEGGGLFGNPTINDMIGTAAGATHTDAFGNISATLSSLMNSSVGQSLNTAIQNMTAAIGTGGQSSALSALTSAVNTFNSQTANNTDLQAAISSAQSSFEASQAHLAKEISNLNLVGLSLANSQPTSTGIGSILNLGNKLHDYGIDKQQLGHNELFSGVATDDLTGDAIQASLLEGRNLAKSYAVGKSTPSVANESALIASASSGSSLA